MCDENTFKNDGLKKYSRRDVGTLAASVGVAMAVPRVVNAVDVNDGEVEIQTPDGVCDAYFAAPVSGAHAAVIMWPDIFGLRPAFRQMGKRLAEVGYSVLVPNPFYRLMPAPTAVSGAYTPIPDVLPHAQSLSPQTQITDTRAFVAWLDAQDEVDESRQIGTMGYCMSGSFTMRGAAALPDRIGAACSYHGGGLVTDAADSPHLLFPQMQAELLIAIAENDDMQQPEAKDVLREAAADANVSAEIEVYPATHGWCPFDTRVYDYSESERAWSRTLELFERALA
ncbi:MAG: dienelactone hydrolase family protein [Gammaproteobacteria bacterium]|nr:dienelactone hydrolase family protein [Gammaproteobacteria bacterium]